MLVENAVQRLTAPRPRCADNRHADRALALKPFTRPGADAVQQRLLPGRAGIARRAQRPIVLDLSRLLSRAYHTTPTGIDRVEFAYARRAAAARSRAAALRRGPSRPAAITGGWSSAAVRQFLAFTQARWQTRGDRDAAEVRAQAIRHLFALRPRAVPSRDGPARLSPGVAASSRGRASWSRSILQTERARLRDAGPRRHPADASRIRAAQRRRRACAARCGRSTRYADGIIGNSQATLDALAPHLTPRTASDRCASRISACEWGDVPAASRAPSAAQRPVFRVRRHDRAAQEPPAAAQRLAAAGRAARRPRRRSWC